MLKETLASIVLLAGITAVATVQADHNSPWGEGWASMPNDIHDTRVDTMDGETQDFVDFVRQGSGSASGDQSGIYSSDERGGGMSRGGGRGGRS